MNSLYYFVKNSALKNLLLLSVVSFSLAAEQKPSVEELRISAAQKVIAKEIATLDQHSIHFLKQWKKVDNYQNASRLIAQAGSRLWQDAKYQIKITNSYDDRPLYWQRLKLSQVIRTMIPAFKIKPPEITALLDQLEQYSRGIRQLEYKAKTHKKILLSGFDPFLLDRNINQSNPSGVIAILLDGKIIQHQGVTAEINAFVVPVKYTDFDQGLIEKILAPFYALNNVDLITTVSMGRKEFDLERFPGKRRSATVPGNQNIYTGASKKQPIISKLYNAPLPGPEFVEFSLPVTTMQKAKGRYQINDNHQVTTLEKTFKAQSLAELNGAIAVEGSGGGYLSNEISYRSIRLRNELKSTIPTGHIHTPRINQYDPNTTQAIVEQVVTMLKQALTEI